jgi:hypothetical protein
MGDFKLFDFKKHSNKIKTILRIATATFVLGICLILLRVPAADVILIFGILLYLIAFFIIGRGGYINNKSEKKMNIANEQKNDVPNLENSDTKSLKPIFNAGWRRIHISLSLIIYPIFIVVYFFIFQYTPTEKIELSNGGTMVVSPYLCSGADVLNLDEICNLQYEQWGHVDCVFELKTDTNLSLYVRAIRYEPKVRIEGIGKEIYDKNIRKQTWIGTDYEFSIEPPFINQIKHIFKLENNYIQIDIYFTSSIIILLIYWLFVLLYLWAKKGFLKT